MGAFSAGLETPGLLADLIWFMCQKESFDKFQSGLRKLNSHKSTLTLLLYIEEKARPVSRCSLSHWWLDHFTKLRVLVAIQKWCHHVSIHPRTTGRLKAILSQTNLDKLIHTFIFSRLVLCNPPSSYRNLGFLQHHIIHTPPQLGAF